MREEARKLVDALAVRGALAYVGDLVSDEDYERFKIQYDLASLVVPEAVAEAGRLIQ